MKSVEKAIQTELFWGPAGPISCLAGSRRPTTAASATPST